MAVNQPLKDEPVGVITSMVKGGREAVFIRDAAREGGVTVDRITNEQREAIVREAVAKRDSLLSEGCAQVSDNPTPVAWRWQPSQVFADYAFTDDAEKVKRLQEHGYTVEPLYATPPASLPVGGETDERAKYEAFMRENCTFPLERAVPSGAYIHPAVYWGWRVWEHLAASPAPADRGAEQDTRPLLSLLREARAAIEPLTEAQIKLHRIKRDLADRIDAALSSGSGEQEERK
jgi:hypothetical protein